MYLEDIWCNMDMNFICQKAHPEGPENNFFHIYHQNADNMFDVGKLKRECTSSSVSCSQNYIDEKTGEVTSWIDLDPLGIDYEMIIFYSLKIIINFDILLRQNSRTESGQTVSF